MKTLALILRRLVAAPAFTLSIVALLALGIGASAAIFSIVDAILFHRLILPHPESLMRVFATEAHGVGIAVAASPTRLTSGLLFGVAPGDRLTHAGAAAVLRARRECVRNSRDRALQRLDAGGNRNGHRAGGRSSADPSARHSAVGVTPLDPATFLIVPAILTVVALIASLVPAGRAARLDPAVALRGE